MEFIGIDEKLGMLCGNHIRRLIRKRTSLSRFHIITYGLRTKECYTNTRRVLRSYTETIYTLLEAEMIQLEYSIGPEETRLVSHAHRKTFRWTAFRPFLATASIIIVFCLGILGLLQETSLSIPVLFLGTYFLFANRIYESRLARQLGPVLNGQYALEIENNIIRTRSEGNLSEISLSNVKAVLNADSLIMLYLTRISFLAVPKRAFADEHELKEFLSLFPEAKPGSL